MADAWCCFVEPVQADVASDCSSADEEPALVIARKFCDALLGKPGAAYIFQTGIAAHSEGYALV